MELVRSSIIGNLFNQNFEIHHHGSGDIDILGGFQFLKVVVYNFGTVNFNYGQTLQLQAIVRKSGIISGIHVMAKITTLVNGYGIISGTCKPNTKIEYYDGKKDGINFTITD